MRAGLTLQVQAPKPRHIHAQDSLNILISYVDPDTDPVGPRFRIRYKMKGKEFDQQKSYYKFYFFKGIFPDESYH